MSENDDDKQYEPSQKKLEDARKKGEIPRSTELNTAAAYAGLVLAAVAIGQGAIERAGAILAGLVARADSLGPALFAGAGRPLLRGVVIEASLALAPIFALPALLVLVSIVGQKGFVVAGSKLAFKASRISPLANAKNKFGRSGLFEFAKSFVKLVIYSACLGLFLWHRFPEILMTTALSPGAAAASLASLSIAFVSLALVVSLVLGAIDMVWQRAEHHRKNRMSRKDLTDEQKQTEGDPHTKQHRRQRGQEIALNQMLADVPRADVVIVNPTHFAVALRWDRTAPGAPVCVAKGVDEIAARIREVAVESSVPLRSDPPLARGLHDALDVGDEVRPDHYAAVAAAIRFAEDMRRKARAR
ncbi:flagellar biosynthetic protein FlhB [Tranquillimonas rosea]|uniref:Flagellar biosynthetic protein FlhB n=1 Tax=Tranquillimonas rosea TaxID=641238 RepID=A0A1H9X4N9_9RHOB|nr:flagellar type III secretion system protein FlhB [Tranquillimonas rosea]SES41112.1 flagellar biosynthetic protein FlhB [Tranquillimonas rosea]